MVLASGKCRRGDGGIFKSKCLPTAKPYFSLDGKTPICSKMIGMVFAATWNHVHGYTNVWSRPQLGGKERLKKNGSNIAFLHLNQKPIEFMEMQILAASNEGDVVWEPFGGLGSASLASVMNGRDAYYAEIIETYYNAAKLRLMYSNDPAEANIIRKAG